MSLSIRRKYTRLVLILGAALALPAADPPPAPLHPSDIIAHLARTISWYRHVTQLEQSLPASSDILARENAQRSATQALQLAFDFGRAATPLAGDDQGASSKSATSTGNVARASAQAEERLRTIQSGLAEVSAELARAAGKKRDTLLARRKELEAHLVIAKEIQQSLQGLRTFLSSQGTGGGADLPAIIQKLERSVPEAIRGAPTPAASPAAPSSAAQAPFRPESAGVFALATEAFRTETAKQQIAEVLAETDTLRKSAEDLRSSVVKDLSTIVHRTDTIGNNSASQDANQMDADRQEIESLTARFKQLSAALVPLREHTLQIETARSSIVEQRNAIQQRYSAAVTQLLFRVLGLLVTIGVVLTISELWRRATFRYVQDARRRNQFLLVRRVVVTGIIAVALVMGLVNEVGSLATYAGLLTAGLAVALQNVIVSIVAYFLLIGRYGLRVGDRVTISGVTGDVVEIGLVRIYLMELAGVAADLQPTGRVVWFSNSVLFQPVALFRQMPGADYVWHTVTLTLAPDTDRQMAETRLMSAVESVYAEYRERLEQQHAAFQRTVDLPVSPPKPEGRLRFTGAGLEFVVRYPADMRRATVMDDQVLNALSRAISQEPQLTLASSGAPRVQGG
jgi:small-conductance mechanosensitive channel